MLTTLMAQGSWWEAGQSGLYDVGDFGTMLLAIVSLIGLITLGNKWLMTRLSAMIHKEISEATVAIQPTTNGGLSLPDTARRVEALEARFIDYIEKRKISDKETVDSQNTLLNYIASRLAIEQERTEKEHKD